MLQDLHDRGIYLTEDEYRTGLRALFPEDYQQLSDAELEDIIYDRIASLSPSEAESLMEGFGSWLKKAVHSVAPIITAALPAIATVAGTAFGGPLGGAAAGFAANMASGAISKATHTQPNQFVSSIGQAATSMASGNVRAAVPSLVNVGRGVGNAVSRGAGNKFAQVATGVAGAAMGAASGAAGGGGAAMSTQAASQLMSFLSSTPLLQSLLSSIVTGSMGTSLQIPKEDGSSTPASYVEMLEALKHLTENAISEADNAGFSANVQLESEAEQDTYIESLIEDVSSYENSLLPNYDAITY